MPGLIVVQISHSNDLNML